VLEAILADPSTLARVSEVLTPLDFLCPQLRSIFAAMTRAAQISITGIAEALGSELERAGGIPALSELADHAVTAANVEAHARAVRRASRERRVRELHERAARGEDGLLAEIQRLHLELESLRAGGDPAQPIDPRFEGLSDDVGYRLTIPALAAALEVTHLRRDRHQLRGEVLARCTLPGAATFDGVLSVDDLNLSSSRSRHLFAAHLAEQARTDTKEWQDAVEEFAQRVLAAERAGEPDVCLPDVVVSPVQILDVNGLRLPRHHSTVLFGDGDSLKSYLALYILGCLARLGLRVLLADWELTEADHRERLGRLFPGAMPEIRYLRCSRAIGHEADRLRRWVRDRKLDFVVMDSVAYASAGAPESAEVAMQYFQVVRQLGPIGSLHVAHITKAEEGADRRPFGSTFWHNSPRATWFCKLAERDPGGNTSRIGLYPRKFNIGPLPKSVGFEFEFGADRTNVRPIEVSDVADLAARLPVKQRMVAALRSGGMPIAELAQAIGAKRNTVQVESGRNPGLFYVEDGVVCLLERRHA